MEKDQLRKTFVERLKRNTGVKWVRICFDYENQIGWGLVEELREAGLAPSTLPVELAEPEINTLLDPTPHEPLYRGAQEIRQFITDWQNANQK